jgi:acyl carrier protein
MENVNASVQTRVLALIKAILAQNSICADVRPQTSLVAIGLTSMDMVKLMLDVEAEFDLAIPQPEITPENFQSASSLEQMIARLCQFTRQN